MATKKSGNGHSEIDVLRDILEAITKLGDDLRSRIDRTNDRLDNLIEITGRKTRDIERRVEAIEARLGIEE